MIDKYNEIWQTFVEYTELISSEGKGIGLDLFGTEQASAMALSFTQTYYINELRKEIGSLFVKDELKRGC